MRVIPCGVARSLFPASGRLGARGADEFVLGFVGSLKPWHGIDILLEAFLQLSYISSNYRLLLVGDGPLRPEVESFCRSHNISPLVTIAGSVDAARVPEYLARIDVGLAPYPPLPSFYFSPLKIWEYAAAGVPIVASASGDLPRLFPHRVAALLHPPGSVGKIVKHVERLRGDRDLGCRLARRARQVAKLHTWDRLAARFETLAKRALASS
jgi:glycosyltransferase involved in cell wall biosynthesis